MEEEQKKEERKRKREAVKEANKQKSKVSKGNGNTEKCLVCTKLVKSKVVLRCDECKNVFHKNCIPSTHKKHIPDEEDDDIFLCQNCYKEESDSSDPESEDEQIVDELYQMYQTEMKQLQ